MAKENGGKPNQLRIKAEVCPFAMANGHVKQWGILGEINIHLHRLA